MRYSTKYERRHRKLSRVLQEIGFDIQPPLASFYQYVRIPKGTEDGLEFHDAEQFSRYLIKEALISTVPWDDVGHYIRLSVTFIAEGTKEENRIIEEIRKRLSSMRLIF